jgi:3-hydroxyisobutyrate dehydrogenase
MKIGIVGLGRMGAAMSQRLREHGHDVVAWDRKAASAKPLADAGLEIAASVRAVAAEADIVISIITADSGSVKSSTVRMDF